MWRLQSKAAQWTTKTNWLTCENANWFWTPPTALCWGFEDVVNLRFYGIAQISLTSPCCTWKCLHFPCAEKEKPPKTPRVRTVFGRRWVLRYQKYYWHSQQAESEHPNQYRKHFHLYVRLTLFIKLSKCERWTIKNGSGLLPLSANYA